MGKWVHIEKVFSQKTAEGQEPVPRPIRDAQGNIDDTKLSTRMPEEQENDKIAKQKNVPTANSSPLKKTQKKK